jgi:hypothetical protein
MQINVKNFQISRLPSRICLHLYALWWELERVETVNTLEKNLWAMFVGEISKVLRSYVLSLQKKNESMCSQFSIQKWIIKSTEYSRKILIPI